MGRPHFMTGPTLPEFEDDLQVGERHALFQDWRQKHPKGFFLNHITRSLVLAFANSFPGRVWPWPERYASSMGARFTL